jgi:uncharacterized BrkB/YihY/UPF0761 family membrane protein
LALFPFGGVRFPLRLCRRFQDHRDQISFLAGLMPGGGIDVVKDQLRALAAQDRETRLVERQQRREDPV